MTKFKTKHKTHGLIKTGAAALITAALLTLALLFTACPQAAAKPEEPPASTDKTYTAGGVSFTMKKIAAVKEKTVGHSDFSNNPPHKVSLSAYFIGETEVTQELWQAVMGDAFNNPSNFRDSLKNPVEQVNWYQAIAFCNKLSLACKLEPCYTVINVDFNTLSFDAIPTLKDVIWDMAELDMGKNGFRLPTEAEWEWAAMGGKDYKWAGTDIESELKNYAWYSANSGNKTHEVKKRSSNGYGLYDMSGNVWEWCWDKDGAKRVFRGGSWSGNATSAARAYRNNGIPNGRDNDLGLRLVCRP